MTRRDQIKALEVLEQGTSHLNAGARTRVLKTAAALLVAYQPRKGTTNMAKKGKNKSADLDRLLKEVGVYNHNTGARADVAETIARRLGPAGAAEALAVLKTAVDEAEWKLSKAGDEFSRARAAGELQYAHQRLTLAKLVRQGAAQASGRLRTRFGPNSVELFKGINTLPDEDPSIRYR